MAYIIEVQARPKEKRILVDVRGLPIAVTSSELTHFQILLVKTTIAGQSSGGYLRI